MQPVARSLPIYSLVETPKKTEHLIADGIHPAGNLIGRYFGLMMEKWLGPDYEKGLENLKRVAEAG